MEVKPPRRGRPTTVTNTGRKITLSIRATTELKAELEKAAKHYGRPLSQEVELRLEQSFTKQAILDDVLELAYGKELAGIVLLIAEAMKSAGRQGAFQVFRNAEYLDRWPSDQ